MLGASPPGPLHSFMSCRSVAISSFRYQGPESLSHTWLLPGERRLLWTSFSSFFKVRIPLGQHTALLILIATPSKLPGEACPREGNRMPRSQAARWFWLRCGLGGMNPSGEKSDTKDHRGLRCGDGCTLEVEDAGEGARQMDDRWTTATRVVPVSSSANPSPTPS